jgi:hypothetical protein
MAVYDQIEAEPAVVYSGSYTDNVMFGDFFSTTLWTGSINRTNSPSSPVGTPQRFVLGSHVNKFKNVGPTGKSNDPINTAPANIWPNSSSRALLPDDTLVEDLSIFDLYFAERFFSKTKNSVAVKFSDNGEIFADSIMPYPPEIILADGGQFVEGAYQYCTFDTPVGILPPLEREPRRFELVLGSPSANANATQTWATMTSSTDGTQVSDDSWCVSFPFQGKYRNVPRYTTLSNPNKYYVDLTQSLHDRGGGDTILSTSINPDPFSSNLWTINWLTEWAENATAPTDRTFSIVRLAQSGTMQIMNHEYHKTSNGGIINAAIPFPSSSYDIFAYKKPNKLPSLETLYRDFFGFYSSGISEVFLSVSYRVGSIERTTHRTSGKFPFCPFYSPIFAKDWGLDSFVDYTSNGVFTSRSVFFSSASSREGSPLYNDSKWKSAASWLGYTKLNGYKYGCYWPTPIGSTCYFRRNRFGQMRDMLEQRPYTKFYDAESSTPLAAAVVAVFSSSTQTWLTSSNPDLNTRDSGIYDFECKSGQPFADRDNE